MSKENINTYNVITEEIVGEYEEKKSKFIAHLKPVNSEEEAMEYISQMKKKYYDARHNCTAMIIGSKKELMRSSDDGEPSGTAGKPMLEVLTGEEITNVVAVVTRYFGGVLLGTGGLVRAYQAAIKDALNGTKISKMCFCSDISVTIPYPDLNNMLYYLNSNNITVLNTDYLENVTINIRVLQENEADTLKGITELTKATAKCNVLGSGFYPL